MEPEEAVSTVLIVDDERKVREIFSRTLEEAGYRPIAVEDGAAALAALDTEHIALVLLDVTMPGMDGVQVVEAIRAREALQTLPIILVTARAELEERVRGLAAGADDYLGKPVHLEELVARVGAHIRAREAWTKALERETQARRAIQAALKSVRRDSSPEAASRWVVAELSAALGGASIALLANDDDGILWPLASSGALGERFPHGVRVDVAAAADLRERAANGEWLSRIGITRSPRPSASRRPPELACIPLGNAEVPFGYMLVGEDATSAGERDSALARKLPILIDLADAMIALLRPALSGRVTR
jgi:CheY-like chemotaxis protein